MPFPSREKLFNDDSDGFKEFNVSIDSEHSLMNLDLESQPRAKKRVALGEISGRGKERVDNAMNVDQLRDGGKEIESVKKTSSERKQPLSTILRKKRQGKIQFSKPKVAGSKLASQLQKSSLLPNEEIEKIDEPAPMFLLEQANDFDLISKIEFFCDRSFSICDRLDLKISKIARDNFLKQDYDSNEDIPRQLSDLPPNIKLRGIIEYLSFYYSYRPDTNFSQGRDEWISAILSAYHNYKYGRQRASFSIECSDRWIFFSHDLHSFAILTNTSSKLRMLIKEFGIKFSFFSEGLRDKPLHVNDENNQNRFNSSAVLELVDQDIRDYEESTGMKVIEFPVAPDLRAKISDESIESGTNSTILIEGEIQVHMLLNFLLNESSASTFTWTQSTIYSKTSFLNSCIRRPRISISEVLDSKSHLQFSKLHTLSIDGFLDPNSVRKIQSVIQNYHTDVFFLKCSISRHVTVHPESIK